MAPVLQVRFLSAAVDLTGVGALAFTSANGVRAFARLTELRNLPVFAVGAATAAAAREAGFAEVRSADGDVAALGRLIAASRSAFDGLVLHPGATVPAGDLCGDLARVGVPARGLAVYETAPLDVPEGFLADLETFQAVLIHSPRAAARVAEILRGASARHLAAYGVSADALAPLETLALGPRTAATLPNEDALLSLLADHRI
jgi:uroporphyrinogen-III synthase